MFDSAATKISADVNYFLFNNRFERNYRTTSFDSSGSPIASGDSNFANNVIQLIQIWTGRLDFEKQFSFAKVQYGGKVSFIDNNNDSKFYNQQIDKLVLDSSQSDKFNYQENNQALYISAAKSLQKTDIKLGIRGEFTQTTGFSVYSNQLSRNNYFRIYPTFSAVYKYNTDNVYSFTLNERINRPNFLVLNPFRRYTSPYSYYQGNPFLQPSYTGNIEISRNFQDKWFTTLYAEKTNNDFGQLTTVDNNVIATNILNFLSFSKYGVSESNSFILGKWLETENQVSIYYSISQPNAFENIARKELLSAYFSTSNILSFDELKRFTGSVSFWYQLPEIDGISYIGSYSSLDAGLRYTTKNRKTTISLTGADILKSTGTIATTTVNGIKQVKIAYGDIQSFRITVNFKLGKSGSKTNLNQREIEDEIKRAK